MAHANIKTEMKGTTSRWCGRAEAKSAAKKIRREVERRLLGHQMTAWAMQGHAEIEQAGMLNDQAQFLNLNRPGAIYISSPCLVWRLDAQKLAA